MRTLVTGAGGFLGTHIVRHLLDLGHEVRGLDLAWTAEVADIERRTGSVLDAEIVDEATKGVDLVIHAAAITDLWTGRRVDYDRVNVVGTCRTLAAARRAGARVVLVSSYTTLIARETSPNALLDERCEVPPSKLCGDYPRTKREAELAAISAAAAGVPVTIVQPGAPVGTDDHRPTPPGRLIRDLALGRVPALLDCTLDLVDAEAVVRAIVTAGERGEPGERYLLTGEDVTAGTLAEMVERHGGKPAPRRRVPLALAFVAAHFGTLAARLNGRPPQAPLTGIRLAARPCRFDNTKARAALGFEPRPLEDCVREAVAWHLAQATRR